MASLDYIDLEKESEGVWVENPRGYAVKVRAFDCPRVSERMTAEVAKALKEKKKTELSREDYADVIRIVVAEEVLIDWRNIDQAPEFSVEKAREFMRDPRLRHFQDFVTASSRESQRFDLAGTELVSKN